MASASALLMSLLAVLVFASVQIVHGCGVNIVNKCSYAVTTCAQSTSKTNINQYQLGPGAQQFLDFGSVCLWDSGSIWPSVGGQCSVPGDQTAGKDKNLADVVEITLTTGDSTYDISNVNAYTIGLSIVVTNPVGGEQGKLGTPRCGTITCAISDIRSFCQGNNQLIVEPSGALVCLNTDGTAGIGPTSNTEIFKGACPDAYSYNFDDATSQFHCGHGSDYEVTICPGGITSVVNESRVYLDQ